MGFLSGGPYYHLQGRTGNNVGRVVKGKNVFSMRPAKSNRPATMLQQGQRDIWGRLISWMSWIAGLVEVGFAEYDAEMSAMNAAVSFNFKRAVTGVTPNFEIDYAKIMYSRGRTTEPEQVSVEVEEGAMITVNWISGVNTDQSQSTDQASFLVYNAVKDKYVTLQNAALRSELTYSLQLPSGFSGDEVHCYMSFVSDKGKPGNSVYLGAFTVL